MFRLVTFCSLAIFTLLALAWISQLSLPKEADYKTLQVANKPKEKTLKVDTFAASTHQIREGVRKDIWFSQEDGSRLHYRMESASSLLSLVPQGDKMEV